MRGSSVNTGDTLGHARPFVLPYARRRRGRSRRLMLTVLLVLVVGGASVRFGPSLLSYLQVLSLQSQCMEWRLPSDQVVWDENPSRTAELSAVDPLYRSPPRITNEASRGEAIERWCPPWFEFCERVQGYPGMFAPVFLHQRTSASGDRRLVVVARRYIGYNSLWCTVIRPGSLFTKPVKMVSKSRPKYATVEIMERPEPAALHPLRLYAGQPDENDASHFTITYEIEGKGTGTIDGWLEDDEWVKLRVRDGPAKPKPGFYEEWDLVSRIP